MKVASILVVCLGNICRSPLGAGVLQRLLDTAGAGIGVSSAGMVAVVGHGADETTQALAAAHGTCLDGHVARQFTRDIGQAHALILAMEPGHKRLIERAAPDLSGRVMLFDHWLGGMGIPDPFGKPEGFHRFVHDRIVDAARLWAQKLVPPATPPRPPEV